VSEIGRQPPTNEGFREWTASQAAIVNFERAFVPNVRLVRQSRPSGRSTFQACSRVRMMSWTGSRSRT
jgi:hypothetical protein